MTRTESPSRLPRSRAASALLVMAAAACDDGIGPGPDLPAIVSVAAAANPTNALAAAVTVEAAGAESLRVRHALGDDVGYTPFVAAGAGEVVLPVLGLAPSSEYDLRVEAWAGGGSVEENAGTLATGPLPAALQEVQMEVTGNPSPGYRITAVLGSDGVGYVIAFDPAGAIRWYRGFAEGQLAELKQHVHGNFTVFVGGTSGWQPVPGEFVEFTPSGEIVRTYGAGAAYFTDNHELLLSVEDGEPVAYHLLGYDHRVTDMTAYGGPEDALLAGHVLLRRNLAGETTFTWNAWDYFSIDDWIEGPDVLWTLSNIDFDHPNSIDFDLDGNYVVSWRHLSEVNAIDAETGEVLWRFGGNNNEFELLDDPLGGISAQHSPRVLENGDLLIYDNGLSHDPPESRAVQYRLDLENRTARLVWEYRHDPPIRTDYVGSVQRLANGNTVIGWGQAGVVTEVTMDGDVVWEGTILVDGASRFVYRILTVPSLYRYETP